jgi:hypothetical protein
MDELRKLASRAARASRASSCRGRPDISTLSHRDRGARDSVSTFSGMYRRPSQSVVLRDTYCSWIDSAISVSQFAAQDRPRTAAPESFWGKSPVSKPQAVSRHRSPMLPSAVVGGNDRVSSRRHLLLGRLGWEHQCWEQLARYCPNERIGL